MISTIMKKSQFVSLSYQLRPPTPQIKLKIILKHNINNATIQIVLICELLLQSIMNRDNYLLYFLII